jgi:hypothetical protein
MKHRQRNKEIAFFSDVSLSCVVGTHWRDIPYLLSPTPWSRVLLEKLTGFSVSQEIHRMSWNPKVHFCVHKWPPPAPILGQIDPVYTRISYIQKIHLNIIPPSTPGSKRDITEDTNLNNCLPLESQIPMFLKYTKFHCITKHRANSTISTA